MDHPAHYTRGSIEVWDFIRDQGLNYHRGNAIKYICRAGYKSVATETQDIKKAIHYLKNELEYLESLSESVAGGSSNTVPLSLWNSELSGEPDYATGFDR
jgi:hypothetical protein|tara:strand:+ start:501 stop:800 length:300 start_codon:yes stop_codon:yes gene_type:complete